MTKTFLYLVHTRFNSNFRLFRQVSVYEHTHTHTLYSKLFYLKLFCLRTPTFSVFIFCLNTHEIGFSEKEMCCLELLLDSNGWNNAMLQCILIHHRHYLEMNESLTCTTHVNLYIKRDTVVNNLNDFHLSCLNYVCLRMFHYFWLY